MGDTGSWDGGIYGEGSVGVEKVSMVVWIRGVGFGLEDMGSCAFGQVSQQVTVMDQWYTPPSTSKP